MKLAGQLILTAAMATLAFSAKKSTDDTSNPLYKVSPVSTVADPSGKPAPPAGFVHPGILVNRAQLDEIKKRVAAGKDPQKTAFEALKVQQARRARLHAAFPRHRRVRFILQARSRLQGRAGR